MQSLNLAAVATLWRVALRPSLARPHIRVPDIRAVDFAALKQAGNRFAFCF